MCKPEVRMFWHWDFFNYSENETEVTVDFYHNQDIRHYFLKLMADIPDWKFDDLQISQLDQRTQSTLIGFLSELSDIDISDNNKEKLQNFFNQISDYKNNIRKNYVVNAKLDSSKIQKFIQKFEERFIENSQMRKKLFISNNKVQYRENKTGTNFPSLVMNYINEKDYFISDNFDRSIETDITSLAVWFSEGFTKTENKFLQSEILKKCDKKQIIYDDFKKELLNRNWQDNEIILFNYSFYHRVIMKPPFYNLIKEVEPKENSFSNLYLQIKNKKVFIATCFMHQRDIDAIMFDISKLPVLKMFNPVKPENELLSFQFLKNIGISIGIDSFSHNKQLMETLIKKCPEWLTKKGDEKDQREHLNQYVNIKILQGIHLCWNNIKYTGSSFSISK